jgi:aminoglycoside 3-N-acetyltransferase
VSERWHYDRESLAEALRAVGVGAGDIVFSHVGLGMLGFPRGERTEDNAADTVIAAYLDVLGDDGTWLVPTYSYTFTKGEPFDPAETPSDVGPLSERFRRRPGVERSRDPLFSVAGAGPRAAELLDGLPHDCFGPDCVYERLNRVGGKLVNAGVGFRYATYIHHVEQTLRVPYRYPKRFTGTIRAGGAEREETWLYNVRPLGEPGALPDLRRLEAEARRRGLLAVAPAGFGQLTAIAAPDMWTLCTDCVRRDPWFLSRAGAEDWDGERPRVQPEVDAGGEPLTVRLGADRA